VDVLAGGSTARGVYPCIASLEHCYNSWRRGAQPIPIMASSTGSNRGGGVIDVIWKLAARSHTSTASDVASSAHRIAR